MSDRLTLNHSGQSQYFGPGTEVFLPRTHCSLGLSSANIAHLGLLLRPVKLLSTIRLKNPGTGRGCKFTLFSRLHKLLRAALSSLVE
jgi:hypothetical protein